MGKRYLLDSNTVIDYIIKNNLKTALIQKKYVFLQLQSKSND